MSQRAQRLLGFILLPASLQLVTLVPDSQAAAQSPQPAASTRSADQIAASLAASKRYAGNFKDDLYSPAHWTPGFSETSGCPHLYSIELQMSDCVVVVADALRRVESQMTPPTATAMPELLSLLMRESALGMMHGAYELCTPKYNAAQLCQPARALAEQAAPRYDSALSEWGEGQRSQAQLAAIQRLTEEQAAVRQTIAVEANRAKAADEMRQHAERERLTSLHLAENARDPNRVTLFNVTIGKPIDYLLPPCPGGVFGAAMSTTPIFDAGAEQCFTVAGVPFGAGIGTQVVFSAKQKQDFPWLLAALRDNLSPSRNAVGVREQSSGRMSSIGVEMIGGNVESLSFETGGKAYEADILDALNEKFGTPVSRRMESYHNEAGATWQNPVYTWRHGNVTVTFQYEAFLANPSGLVTVTSDRAAQSLKDAHRSKSKL